jgi:SAM-dependent methyltransferase
MGTPAVSLPPSALDTPAGELPLTVWPCAQTSPQYQRAGRYLPASTAHPAKMLPELARRIIAEYSPPGGLVVDPMCGIGTTLVEAAALGRRAVGVELEPRWAELARANLGFALPDQQARRGQVRLGDARHLTRVLADLAGTVDLVATSPPYACDVGMIDKPAWLAGRSLCRHDTLNYSTEPANLGHARGDRYLAELASVYAGCIAVLRPGGCWSPSPRTSAARAGCWIWPPSRSSWPPERASSTSSIWWRCWPPSATASCMPGRRSGSSLRLARPATGASPPTWSSTRTCRCSHAHWRPPMTEHRGLGAHQHHHCRAGARPGVARRCRAAIRLRLAGRAMQLVPVTVRDANRFVQAHHRHAGPVPGAKFVLAASSGDELVGVALVGRPVARALDDDRTLEVRRMCTTGAPNACSLLLGAAWRAAKALGYRRLVTYTLATESGASLRAAGFRATGRVAARSWSCPSRARIDKHPLVQRVRWEICR